MRRPTTFAEVNNGRSFVRLVTVISRHCSLAEWFLVIHRYIYSVKVLFGCTSFAIIHRIELYPIIDTEYRVFIILLPSHLTDRVLMRDFDRWWREIGGKFFDRLILISISFPKEENNSVSHQFSFSFPSQPRVSAKSSGPRRQIHQQSRREAR